MSRSERRAKLTREGKRPLPKKGTYARRVIPFDYEEMEVMAPGKTRQIVKTIRKLHVTKGFRVEQEIRNAPM